MDTVLSCRELKIPNSIANDKTLKEVLNTLDLTSFLLIGTTPFSLPYSIWKTKTRDERINWLYYRYSIFEKGLLRSLKNQKNIKLISTNWFIFLSRGDRKILNIDPFIILDNGINIHFIEVDELDGEDQNYYQQFAIPNIINQFIRANNINSYLTNSRVLTVRVDSDDLISDQYLSLLTFVSFKSMDTHSDLFMSFVNGAEYCFSTKSIQPKIWPEPPFISRLEKISGENIFTVWEFPHDEIPVNKVLSSLITTNPFWVITTGSNNMSNRTSENKFCQPKSIEFEELANYLLI